ncbi:MAG: nucleoside-triphosphatase [Bacteroidota bacterium]
MQKSKNNIWIKAAVMASFWASFEIIVGSFFHNMRIPFSGTILASMGVAIMVSFQYMWKQSGLVWRAGLITALLKAVSPSGIIIGPMVGIFTEAIFVEFITFILGRNLISYIFAGGFAVFSALLHKVVMMLIIYGWDLVKVLDSFYQFLVKKAGIENLSAFWLILLVSSVYFVAGAIGGTVGYLVAKKAKQLKDTEEISIEFDHKKVIENVEEKYSLSFLTLHLVLLISGIFVINYSPLWLSTLGSLTYIFFVVKYYDKAVFHLRKNKFWLQLLVITFIASLFWNKFTSGDIFSLEGMIVGYKITLRAAMMIVGFSALSVELKNPFVKNLLYNKGLRNLYWAMELSFSSLPSVMKIANPVKSIKSPLEFFPMMLNQADKLLSTFEDQINSNVIIITGDTQSGKTGFLSKVQQSLQERSIGQVGFLADSIYEDEQIQGHIIKDLSSSDSFRISYREYMENSQKIGRFYLLNEGLEFGKSILRKINSSESGEVVIVDEVGRLELDGGGWAPEVKELLEDKSKPVILIVRGKYLDEFVEKFQVNSPYIFYPERDRVKDAVKAIENSI